MKKNMLGYYKLSRHYKFALDSIFKLYPDSHGVIIVEGKLPVRNVDSIIDRLSTIGLSVL